jgi:hypothetical protein
VRMYARIISATGMHKATGLALLLPILVSFSLASLVAISASAGIGESSRPAAYPSPATGLSDTHTSLLTQLSQSATFTSFRSHPAIHTPIVGGRGVINGAGFYSTNWGGDVYCANSGCGGASSPSAVEGVEASWQVSSLESTSSSAEYASTWVGIGGWDTSDLVQAGLVAEVLPGDSVYYEMWWEMLPASSTGVFLSPDPIISPGDVVFASVIFEGLNSGGYQLWQFTVGDQTTSSQWQGTEACGSTCTGSSFSTADWIQETPVVNGALVQMPAFSSFAFSNPEYYTGATGWTYLSASTPNLNWAWQRNTAFTSEATVIPSALYTPPNVLYMDYVVSTHNGPSIICCKVSPSSGEPHQLVQGAVNLSSPDSFGSSSSSNLGVDLILANASSTVCRDRADGAVGFSVGTSLNSYPVAFRACSGIPYGTYYVLAEVWYVPLGESIGGTGSLLLSTIGGESVSPLFTLFGPSVTLPQATPSSGQIDSGQTVNFSVIASGGSGGYSLSWHGLPSSCQSENLTHLECSNVPAGNFSISVTAVDSSGGSFTSSSLEFTVNPDPTATAPVTSRPSADAGQSVTFSTTVVGGTSPDVFAWFGLPISGCTGTTSASVTCTPLLAQNLAIRVSVTDAVGETATSSTLSFTVNSAPSVVLEVTPGAVLQGGSVTFTAVASGGAGDWTFEWSGLPGGCSAPTGSTLACSPSSSGSYQVSVTATDQVGGKTTGVANLTVSPSFIGLPAEEGYAIVGVLIVALLVILLVVAARRRNRRDQVGSGGGSLVEGIAPNSSPGNLGTRPQSTASSPGGRSVGAGVPEAVVSPVRFDAPSSGTVGLDPGSVYIGAPMVDPPSPRCWHCQFENPPGSRYCTRCAMPLEPPPHVG